MANDSFCGTTAAFDTLPGRGAKERFAALGLEPGTRTDLGNLAALHEQYGFSVYLYFDEDLVRVSTLQDDLEDFRVVPEVARPFMPLPLFLRTMRRHDPVFSPEGVAVEVIDCGAMQETYGCVLRSRSYVRGLLLEPGQ